MVYIRGNRADYDEWAAAGCDGLGLRRRAAVLQARGGQRARRKLSSTGSAGRSRVARAGRPTRWRTRWSRPRPRHGLPANDDLNGAEQDGVGRYQLTQRNGRRCSTAVSYLHPAVERGPTSTSSTDALATRILFEGDRAVGVEVLRTNRLEQFRRRARGDRVRGRLQLATAAAALGHRPGGRAGAARHRSSSDLPVGRNLQDHASLLLVWRTDQESLIDGGDPGEPGALRARGSRPAQLERRRGRRVHPHSPGLDAPDVQFHFDAVMLHEDSGPLVDHASSIGRRS